jgi:hypothetical protein
MRAAAGWSSSTSFSTDWGVKDEAGSKAVWASFAIG